MKTIILLTSLLFATVVYSQSDSVQYAELTAQSTSIDREVVNEKFKLYFNCYTETMLPKLLPYQYPIDALNYLAKQGWRLVCVFSVKKSTEPTEERHYELEKKN